MSAQVPLVGPKCSWKTAKAKQVLKALLKTGWKITHQTGSHKKIKNENTGKIFDFAFHDGEELGPRMLSRIAKYTDLKPQDLYL